MTKSTKDIITIILALILCAILIGVGPVLTILSLNVLFNTGIAINFYSWLAAVWLSAVTFGGILSKLKQ